MIDLFFSDTKFTVSLILGVLSVVLAIAYYHWGVNTKLFCYTTKKRVVIDSTTTGENPIRVTFSGEPITTLAQTHIAIWNNGRQTIRREDISALDPVRIVATKQARILSAEIAITNRPSNGIAIYHDRFANVITVEFEFLDYKNGAVIKLYHTGAIHDIDLVGTIKGTDRLIDTNQMSRRGIAIAGRLTDRWSTLMFLLVPKRLMALYGESHPSFLRYLLISLPVILLSLPTFILFMPIITVVTLVILIASSISESRYSTPKELYSLIWD
jgi:hypothetical protein